MKATGIHIDFKDCLVSRFTNGLARVVVYLIFLIIPVIGFCADGVEEDDHGNYDEVLVTVNVQRIGSVEMPALINNKGIYLPVKELFDFLKIRNVPSSNMDSIAGFFIDANAEYLFDQPNKRITYQNKVFNTDTAGMRLTETNLFVKIGYLGSIFGLDCIFNFRSLSVNITSKFTLPAIRELQQELMRKNVIKLKGEKRADTTIARNYSLFHLGVADWSVISSQQTRSAASTRINLNLGLNVAGGATDIYLTYNNQEDLIRTPQYYRWRYVNNDNRILKQVTAGRLFTQSISSISAPVIGVQVNNTPTTYRRSFGTYTLSNTTEPGWMVELYVNNVMVNYMQADASGFFSFEVPMVYGNSVVRLRFFGPWGEERTREQSVSIPFNFLPAKQFEYSLTTGIIQDAERGKFSRAVFNYGLNKRVTIGGGTEYLSTTDRSNLLPFVNASVRLASSLLLTGEHADGVLSKGVISYRMPSNLQFDINYTKYVQGQTAIRYNYIDEKKATVTMPFRHKKFTAFSRLTINEITLPKNKFTNAELLVSSVVKGVSSNFTTNAVFTDPKHPLVYSNLSLTFRLPAGIRVTPQTQFDYNKKRSSMLKMEVEKCLLHNGYLNMSYEKNVTSKTSYVTMGLRYNFSFAQTSFTARHGNKTLTTVQSARGSLVYDDNTDYLNTSSLNNIGKGGIVIAPFLDINCNGVRDPNEHRVLGVNLHVNGGRSVQNPRDTTLVITGLEAYTNCFIEMDKNSFENISWEIRKKTISVAVDPNKFKFIEVPISVMGEVAGTVYISNHKGKSGISRVIVDIYNAEGKVAGHTLTEADGYFSFLGLAPGKYTARINEDQLSKLHMATISKNEKSFVIKVNKDGDVVDDLEFTLREEVMYVKK